MALRFSLGIFRSARTHLTNLVRARGGATLDLSIPWMIKYLFNFSASSSDQQAVGRRVLPTRRGAARTHACTVSNLTLIRAKNGLNDWRRKPAIGPAEILNETTAEVITVKQTE